MDLITCTPSQKISEAGLQTLIDIGYNVEYKEGEYKIQFAEKEKPLKLILYSCSDKKTEKAMIMKLKLNQLETTSEGSETTLFNSPKDSKEMFQLLATDLYLVIKGLKK